MSAFEQIRLLYDQKLYSNVVSLASFVLLSTEQSTDVLSPTCKFQTYVYYGDALFNAGQYRKAERIYQTALQFRKSLLKSKGSSKPQETLKELTSDIDIRYQMFLCHNHLKHMHQAMNVLQEIPAKQRNSRINMALAKLYQQGGSERSAITCYKEVLRECPLALEAAEGLLSLGVKGNEVQSLIMEGNPQSASMDWLKPWIAAQAHYHQREYTSAVAMFRQMDERTTVRGHISLLVSWGKSHYYSGDNRNALRQLQRAHALDPYMTRGLDNFAALLVWDKDCKQLEILLPPGLTVAEYSPEAWIALAYQLNAAKKHSKALYFAQKACYMSPRNVEALILKGGILNDLKKYEDAAVHFREAMQIAPYRYEPHIGLVDCYVSQRKFREALTFSCNALKQLGETPRSLTLNASVLMKDPVSVSVHATTKAKLQLEKALSQDPLHLPAVYLLVEIYEQEEVSLDAAIHLLEQQVGLQPTCKLHQMLGDLLARVHDEEKALDHYNQALKLDPENRRVLEGIHRIDHTSSKLDTTYYMTVGDEDAGDTTFEKMADSDNEDAGDTSETEAVWSDMDLEASSQ